MPKDRTPGGGVVYSTRHGKMCPRCSQPVATCACARERKLGADRPSPNLPADGTVRVSRQTKGRKGKGVTLVTGIPLQGLELVELAKELKQRCGSGGTVKDGVIEIQGEHRDILVEELRKRGWKVKKV